MKNLLNTSLFLFLLISSAYSQITFEVNYGTTSHDVGSTVQETIDGKNIVVGSTYSDSTGNGDVYLGLLDTNGTLLWTKSIGGIMDDAGNCVRQTPDSGFIIAGTTESYGNGQSDVYLIKTDQNGDTLWTKTYGGANFDYGNSVQNTLDGGFIITGQESSSDSIGIAHIYLVKTDSIGDSLWTRSYAMAAWTGAIGIIQTPDSGYMVFGDFENDNVAPSTYDLVWMKTNSSGDTLWSKTYEDTIANNYAQSIRQTSDGGFILASQMEDAFSFSTTSLIIRLDGNGDTVWTKSVGDNYDYAINDIFETSDSDFVSVGYTYDTTLLANYLYLVKLNDVGDSLWAIKFDGLFSATGFSVEQTSDNGIVFCGMTYDSTLTEANVYVVKTDGNGEFVLCQPFISSQPADTLVEDGSDALFIISASSPNLIFQWQIDTNGTFLDLSDTLSFSGTGSETLIIDSVNLSMSGFIFRCIVSDSSCVESSTAATLTVTNTIGIISPEIARVILYPNPARQLVSIAGQVPERVVFYDVYGNTIAEFRNRKNFDVSSIATGLYFVKITYRNSESIQKLIKE